MADIYIYYDGYILTEEIISTTSMERVKIHPVRSFIFSMLSFIEE